MKPYEKLDIFHINWWSPDFWTINSEDCSPDVIRSHPWLFMRCWVQVPKPKQPWRCWVAYVELTRLFWSPGWYRNNHCICCNLCRCQNRCGWRIFLYFCLELWVGYWIEKDLGIVACNIWFRHWSSTFYHCLLLCVYLFGLWYRGRFAKKWNLTEKSTWRTLKNHDLCIHSGHLI